jgi:hypothetical protein
MLKQRNTTEAERRREQFVDRGAETLLGGYSEDQLEDAIRHCWTALDGVTASGKGKRVLPVQVESWLRTSVDILFGHSMLRGENTRGAELPDLFTVEMKDEGPTPCWPMLLANHEQWQDKPVQ